MSKPRSAHVNLHVKKSQRATRYRIRCDHWLEPRLGSRVAEPRPRGLHVGERKS